MRNRELFARDPLESKLLNNGVAKVVDAHSDEELTTLRFELESFVCEGEYERGLERILGSYVRCIDDPEQPAVWVSGFYGSGKSHLVKVLRYLWEDFEFPSDKATARGICRLPDSIQDHLRELTNLSRRIGGLRAACGTLGEAGGESVRLALLAIVFRSVGLPEDFAQASFVMWLRSRGIDSDVKKAVEESGEDFYRELRHLYVSPLIAESLLKADPELAGSTSEARNLIKNQFPRTTDVSSDEMVTAIRDALSVDDRLPCTLIVLDELQQYIGGDSDRTYKVQEMTEACCKKLGGRVLFVGTGQAALTGTPQLEKLKGRFKIGVQLSDTDVEQVTREVVLRKRSDKISALREVLDKHSGEISRQLSGTKIESRPEDTDTIIADYPLLPVRRRFWEHVLRAVDRAGTAGQLRTQLKIVHEAVQVSADADVGTVIPADFLYDQISTELLQSGALLREIEQLIRSQADGTPDGELRGRLCALIFLIGALPSEKDAPTSHLGVHASPDVLADLLAEDLVSGSSELRRRIPALLEKLTADGQILRVGDDYRIQTRESRAWDQAYQNARSRIANDLQRLSSERAQLLRDAVSEALRGMKLLQGKSRVSRKVDYYYNDDIPEPSGQSIPIWIRDEWSVSLSAVQADAREAGTNSPVLHVFLPKKCAEDLKNAICSWKAAEETIGIKGAPGTDEGEVARQGMETRASTEKKKVEQILREVLQGARVYLGGGSEVSGLDIRASVEEAADAALVRLYPEFNVADHPKWDEVIKRAKKGDSNALEAVGYEGDVEHNPVCSPILRSLNSWRKGKDVRTQFMSPAYGWSQDAVSGALLALVASGHAIARYQNVPQQVKDLDQTIIGVAEFRAETTVLTAQQRMTIRKMLQSVGLTVKSGEESVNVPRFLDALLKMADDAGGDPPLPERPDRKHLLEIQAINGIDQLQALLDKRDKITHDIEVWTKAKDKIAERWPAWGLLCGLLNHARELPVSTEVAPEIDAIRSDRLLLTDPDPVAEILSKTASVLREELGAAHQNFMSAFRGLMASLEANELWSKIDPKQREELLASAGVREIEEPSMGNDRDLLESLNSISIADWNTSTDALEARFRKVALELSRMFEPKAVPFRLPAATLKTEADVDAWLSETRKQILKKLEDPNTGAITLGG